MLDVRKPNFNLTDFAVGMQPKILFNQSFEAMRFNSFKRCGDIEPRVVNQLWIDNILSAFLYASLKNQPIGNKVINVITQTTVLRQLQQFCQICG